MPDRKKYVLELSSEDAILLGVLFREKIKTEADFLGRATKNETYMRRYPGIVKSSEQQLELFSRAYSTIRGTDIE